MTTQEKMQLSAILVPQTIVLLKWWWEARRVKKAEPKPAVQPAADNGQKRVRSLMPPTWFLLPAIFSIAVLSLQVFSDAPATRSAIALVGFASACVAANLSVWFSAFILRFVTDGQLRVHESTLQAIALAHKHTGELIVELSNQNRQLSQQILALKERNNAESDETGSA